MAVYDWDLKKAIVTSEPLVEGKSPSSLPMPSGIYTSGLSNLTFNGDYVTATFPMPPFSITSKFRRINDSEAEFTDLKTGKAEVDKFRYIPEADLIILGEEGIEFTKVKS